jgi:hypothetical protein
MVAFRETLGAQFQLLLPDEVKEVDEPVEQDVPQALQLLQASRDIQRQAAEKELDGLYEAEERLTAKLQKLERQQGNLRIDPVELRKEVFRRLRERDGTEGVWGTTLSDEAFDKVRQADPQLVADTESSLTLGMLDKLRSDIMKAKSALKDNKFQQDRLIQQEVDAELALAVHEARRVSRGALQPLAEVTTVEAGPDRESPEEPAPAGQSEPDAPDQLKSASTATPTSPEAAGRRHILRPLVQKLFSLMK